MNLEKLEPVYSISENGLLIQRNLSFAIYKSAVFFALFLILGICGGCYFLIVRFDSKLFFLSTLILVGPLISGYIIFSCKELKQRIVNRVLFGNGYVQISTFNYTFNLYDKGKCRFVFREFDGFGLIKKSGLVLEDSNGNEFWIVDDFFVNFEELKNRVFDSDIFSSQAN